MKGGIQALLEGTRRGLGSLQVVMATGLYKTAAGIVGQKALKDSATALRAYLTISLRDADAAVDAFAALEDLLEHGTREELEKGPSKRAALFLAARNFVEYERLFGDIPNRPLSSVPWAPTPPGKIDGWGSALDELRFGLGEEEGEILALAHVFSLSHADIAYVLDVPRAEVERRVLAGEGFARLLLEPIFDGAPPPLPSLCADAYKVEPPSKEQLARTRQRPIELPAGTLIGDRYEVESVIGGGEFAFVYRARDVRVPGHTVALKLLHRVARTPAAREGAIRELSLIASAFHPSLVQFKDHGWYEDRLWFVMPFYEGELLLERLEEAPLELDDALRYFERLARGLAALHAAGIRHQDVKPENIFLVELRTGSQADSPETLPVLLDLGVAAPQGEMALAGTPMYFPPEMAAHIFDSACPQPLTPKADVFALALSFLHSIEVPDLSDYENLDVEEFLRRRSKLVPKGPRDESLAWLKPHFARWLAADPAERPTAGQMADEIAEVRRGNAGVSVPAASGRSRGGIRALLVAVCFGFLLAVSAAVNDVPARPIEAAADEPAAGRFAGGRQGDERRMLQHRLDLEERRALALEEEVARLRRLELGVEVEEQATSEASSLETVPSEPPSSAATEVDTPG